MKIQGYCDIFLWTILKRPSTQANVYMRRHQGAKVEHFDVSNVIYHEFSHGAVSYTLNEENVYVMLEYLKILNNCLSSASAGLRRVYFNNATQKKSRVPETVNSGDNSDIFSCFSVKTYFVTSRWWWDLAGKSDIIFLFLN